MMIRNIVFDMGGVLVSYDPLLSCRLHAEGEDEAKRLCDAIFGPDWPRHMDSGDMSEADYLALVQSKLDTPELKRKAEIIFRCWHTEAMAPMPGMAALTEELLERGFRLYLLSNAGLRLRLFQHLIPHAERFSGILVSAEERVMKPDTAIYNRLCEKYALRPSECVFIDDVPRNAEGAEKAGMRAYRFDGDADKLREFLLTLTI